MILVDTSVWVDHLRDGDAEMVERLRSGDVLVHPFVIGELALGNLSPRGLFLGSFVDLQVATIATDVEVMAFIEQHGFHGRGIGYVDAHLLASTLLTPNGRIWTRDRRILEIAAQLGVSSGLP